MGISKWFLIAFVLLVLTLRPLPVFAQQNEPQGGSTVAPQTGVVMGTITDVNGSPIPGAAVILQGNKLDDVRSVTTSEGGFFEIRDVEPGRPFQVIVRSQGFSEWQSPAFTLEPGQSKIMDVSNLQIKEVETTVTVTPETTQEIATEQVKVQEKQRGFGIVPNFYATYDSNPAPLTTGLRFRLALRVASDPFTFGGVAFLAGIDQAADNPDYVQGAKGYGERFAANYANSFTDIMLEGAVIPSLVHQDPRYFYKGTGSGKSRAAHVVESLFVTKGDNGNWEPNYSLLGGSLASAGLQELYYPKSNRGPQLFLQSFATTTAIHVAVRMLDEFVFRPAKGSVAN